MGIGALAFVACTHAEPTPERRVYYWERAESGYQRVYFFPDNGCEVRLAYGAHMGEAINFAVAPCTEEEREHVLQLFGPERQYDWASSVETVPLDETIYPPGYGTPNDPSVPITSDYVVGTVRFSGYDIWSDGWLNVDEAGEKEMELIQFFRGLYEKYSDEDLTSESAPAGLSPEEGQNRDEADASSPDEPDLDLEPDEADLREDGSPEPAPEVPNPGASSGGTLPDCWSGSQDGTETDVDCGGPCEPCQVGGICLVDQDCDTDSCQAGVCAR